MLQKILKCFVMGVFIGVFLRGIDSFPAHIVLSFYGFSSIWWFVSMNHRTWATSWELFKMRRRANKGVKEKVYSYKSIDEMFESFAKEHWVQKTYWTLRRYWLDLLDFPLDFHRAIKRWYQRGSRGWADEDIWSMDGHLAVIIAQMLKHLKEIKHGTPMSAFRKSDPIDKTGNFTDKATQKAEKRWDEILEGIIKTFEIAQKIGERDYFYQLSKIWSKKEATKFDKIWDDSKYRHHPKPRALTRQECRQYEKGWELFQEHFFSLWD